MADFSKEVFGDWNPKGAALVEASAGTGKTYSIQSAYLRLVLEGHSVTNILVVTFTEAATAELRDRLRSVLEECRGVLEKHRADLEAFRSEVEVEKKEKRAWEALLGARQRGAATAELNNRVETARAWFDRAAVYSIHGFCNHVLNQFAFEAGHERDAELQEDADGAVREACRDWWRRNYYGGEKPKAGSNEEAFQKRIA